MKILIGEYPVQDSWLKGGFNIPLWLKEVPAELPGDLLQRRPDLRALELKVSSSGFRVLAANRAWFPKFKLTGQTQSSGRNAGYGAFLQVTFPVFDGYQNRAEYEAELAAREELAEEYNQKLLVAFNEAKAP